jgi:hypothetical protein
LGRVVLVAQILLLVKTATLLPLPEPRLPSAAAAAVLILGLVHSSKVAQVAALQGLPPLAGLGHRAKVTRVVHPRLHIMALVAVALEQLVAMLLLAVVLVPEVADCHLPSQVRLSFVLAAVVVATPPVSLPALAVQAAVELVLELCRKLLAQQTLAVVAGVALAREVQAVPALLLYHRLLQRHQPQALQRFHL